MHTSALPCTKTIGNKTTSCGRNSCHCSTEWYRGDKLQRGQKRPWRDLESEMNPCRKFTLLWSIWRPKEQQQKCYTFRHHLNSRNVDQVKLLNTFFFNFTAIKQTLISISSEPDRSKSLWITTQLTLPSCLESVCMGNMVSRFQIWKKKKNSIDGPGKLVWKRLLRVSRNLVLQVFVDYCACLTKRGTL